jgi:sterol O-acyltransferase
MDLLLFSFAPVLCYEPSFPRTSGRRIAYLAEKLFLAAGLLMAALFLFTQFVAPVLATVACTDELTAIAQVTVPFFVCMLLVFFLVFECVCNAFAELTCFGPRTFYSEWWQSTTFLEFSRLWNAPVHHWLARHCYIDAQRRLGLSQTTALGLTFAFSIAVHEAIIFSALGRVVTPYLALLSLLQLPLAVLQRARWIKGKRLGNLVLWLGLSLGMATTLILYAKEVAGPCSSTPQLR